MASISKELLSGPIPNGAELIALGYSSTPGDTLHTSPSGTASVDEVYLFAVNNSSSDVLVTVVWGANASEINFTIPSKVGLVPVVEKLLLTDSAGVSAYADTTGVINMGGYVNRITY